MLPKGLWMAGISNFVWQGMVVVEFKVEPLRLQAFDAALRPLLASADGSTKAWLRAYEIQSLVLSTFVTILIRF